MNWEFDSHLEITTKLHGTRIVQVWSRKSFDECFWTITEDSPKGENPPKNKCGYWTSLNSFKIAFPNFNR